MRDIKFRGKSIDTGEWLYGSYNYFDENHGYPIQREYRKYHCIKHYVFMDFGIAGWEDDEIDLKTLGQYVGLKDKNGKEIYEGDIVKVENIDLAQIIYDEDRMAWGIKPIDEFYFDSPFLADNINLELEVVDNIYNNPDLIKE